MWLRCILVAIRELAAFIDKTQIVWREKNLFSENCCLVSLAALETFLLGVAGDVYHLEIWIQFCIICLSSTSYGSNSEYDAIYMSW